MVNMKSQENDIGNLKERWKQERKNYKRFDQLMETYIDEYLQGKRGAEGSHSRADMENTVSNHSKWNRMRNHQGQGKQYKEDLRRICFLFHLTYLEANELLWSAGQVFDMNDFRDYILMYCLKNEIYLVEEINEILKKEKLEELFLPD